MDVHPLFCVTILSLYSSEHIVQNGKKIQGVIHIQGIYLLKHSKRLRKGTLHLRSRIIEILLY